MERSATAQSEIMNIHERQPDEKTGKNGAAAGSGRNAAAPRRHILEEIRAILEEGKADDIVVLDISARSALADYMVIAGGASARHLGALADKLMQMLKAQGCGDIKTEGMGSADWVVIDEGDVIIHLFRPEIRAFYRLEKMWGEANDFEILTESDSAARDSA